MKLKIPYKIIIVSALAGFVFGNSIQGKLEKKLGASMQPLKIQSMQMEYSPKTQEKQQRISPQKQEKTTPKDLEKTVNNYELKEKSSSKYLQKLESPVIGSKLIKNIIEIESSNNPNAVSKMGAVGLFQIMPITLKDYNELHQIKYTLEDLKNPIQNTKVGEWQLNKRLPEILRHKNVPDSKLHRIIAYNRGGENLRKWYANGSKFEELPKETKNYLKKLRLKGHSI